MTITYALVTNVLKNKSNTLHHQTNLKNMQGPSSIHEELSDPFTQRRKYITNDSLIKEIMNRHIEIIA